MHVEQSVVDDLHQRLQNTRLPDSDDPSGWSHGTSLEYMRSVIGYWLHEYDWRAAEAEINKFDHYKVTIDGTEIHYIHQKSNKPNAKVILLNHGWPDSFYRFHAVIPLLLDDYDVVVPSLPGFGFSERKAMNSKEIAALFKVLMNTVLGYEKFYTAGGDKGTGVVIDLARDYSDVVEAIHLTDTGWSQPEQDKSSLTEQEKDFNKKSEAWYMSHGAYIMMQSTKPLTVAYGLNDSPAGLVAWAASYAASSRSDHDVDAAFGGRDAFLTTMMIYWITQTIGTAMQMYQADAALAWSSDWSPEAVNKLATVPASFALFPNELPFPKEWAERQGFNVHRFTTMPTGGHFAPMEVPDLYADNLKHSFEK